MLCRLLVHEYTFPLDDERPPSIELTHTIVISQLELCRQRWETFQWKMTLSEDTLVLWKCCHILVVNLGNGTYGSWSHRSLRRPWSSDRSQPACLANIASVRLFYVVHFVTLVTHVWR